MKKIKIADTLYFMDLEKVAPVKAEDIKESSEAGVIQQNQIKAIQDIEVMTKKSIREVKFLLKSLEDSIASKSLKGILQNLENVSDELNIAEKFV